MTDQRVQLAGFQWSDGAIEVTETTAGSRWSWAGHDGWNGWLLVEFPAPWQLQAREVFADEVVESWAAPGAEAVLRHTIASVWHLDLAVSCATSVVAPILRTGSSEAAPWVLAAGNLGRLWWLGAGLDAVVEWRQVQGWCQPAPESGQQAFHMHDSQASLAAGGLALLRDRGDSQEIDYHLLPGRFHARWRAERFSVAYARAGLPSWLPDSLIREVGDNLELHLPDAAVSAPGGVTITDACHEVEILPGPQLVRIADANGVVDVDVVGTRRPSDAVHIAADAIVGSVDPRTATGVELWLVGQADRAEERTEFRLTALENAYGRLLRSGGNDPFLLAGVASELGRLAPDDAHDLLSELAQTVSKWWSTPHTRLMAPAGSSLAASRLLLACMLVDADLPRPGGLVGGGLLGGGLLARLEHDIAVRAAAPNVRAIRACSAALGRGLPGVSTHLEQQVVAAGLVRLLPEPWFGLEEGSIEQAATSEISELNHLITSAERFLAAGNHSMLAWLLW